MERLRNRLIAWGRTRRSRRAVVVAVIAVSPVAAMAWSGCSDDNNQSSGFVQVDPGGTFGAEITIDVVGPGRVISTLRGVNCPTSCYARFIVDPNATGAQPSSVGLKAVSTQGSRFLGWKFETDPVGTRGRGPDSCNPVKRAGEQPAVGGAAEITLPFGETQGSAPAGQEGACAGLTTVPLLYKIVATFESPPIPDAGPDAGGEVLFEPPVAGAVAKEIAVIGSYLYWRFEVGGNAGIAAGFKSSPGTAQVLVQATTSIPQFTSAFTSSSTGTVAYQDGTGKLAAWTNGSTTTVPPTMTGAPVCDALAAYSSSIVFCSSAGSVYSWSASSGTPLTPQPLLTNAPAAGERFAADASYFYFVNDPGGTGLATVQRVLRSSVDGGAAGLVDYVTGLTSPTRLAVTSSSYAVWIDYDAAGNLGSLRSSYTAPTATTVIPTTPGLSLLALDPSSSTYVWGGIVPTNGQNCQLVRGSVTGTTAIPVVQNITNMGGFAVDTSYVYWTQSDGRVYRRLKN